MKKGDRVVCIKTSRCDSAIKGQEYVIESIFEHPTERACTAEGIIHPVGFVGFRLSIFRKIDEQKLSNATTKELAGWAKEHVEQERTPKKIRIFTTEAEF